MKPKKQTYLLLTFNMKKLRGIFDQVAITTRLDDIKQIKEGMIVGDEMFKWAKVTSVNQYGEPNVAMLDNEQLIYNSPDADFPGWFSREELHKYGWINSL